MFQHITSLYSTVFIRTVRTTLLLHYSVVVMQASSMGATSFKKGPQGTPVSSTRRATNPAGGGNLMLPTTLAVQRIASK